MELRGKTDIIKYVRKIAGVGQEEAKEIVDAFINVRIGDGAPFPTLFDSDIVILSLFVGKIKSGEWVIRDGKIFREATVSYRDIVGLTKL